MLWWSALLVVVILSNSFDGSDGMTSRRSHNGGADKKIVYIGGLLPNASVVISSIQNAIRDINYSPSVLSHHQLQFIFAENEECDVTRGFHTYLDFVDTLPRKLLLLNGLCTEIIRMIDRESRTPRGNARALQVSYATMDPSFDSSFQSSLFRMLPAETDWIIPRTQLLQEISSSTHDRIGLIYQNHPTYSAAHEEQVNQLIRLKFVRLESEGFEQSATDYELRSLLRRLRDKNVNFILGNFNSVRARQILCLAYKEGMYGENYTWLLAGNFEPNWWRWVGDDADCSTRNMETVMDGMLRIDILPFYGKAFDKKHEDHSSFHHGRRTSKLDGYIYDAMWAMAYALDNVSYHYTKMTHSPLPNPTEDFISNNTISFQNPVWDEALHVSLANVKFQGITGPVSFNRKNGRIGFALLVKQFQSTAASGYDEVNVGEFDSVSNTLNLVKYPHRMIKKRSQIVTSKATTLASESHPKHNEEAADQALRHIAGVGPATTSASTAVYMASTAIILTAFASAIFQIRLQTLLAYA